LTVGLNRGIVVIDATQTTEDQMLTVYDKSILRKMRKYRQQFVDYLTNVERDYWQKRSRLVRDELRTRAWGT